jgi:hypothetical protein
MINYLNIKWLPLMGTLLWAAVSLSRVVAADEIGKSVQVKSVTCEPAGKFLRVKVQLVNTSTQLITGYALAATAVFANGQMAHGEITADTAWVLVNERMGYPPASDEVFGPGQVTTPAIDVRIEASADYRLGVSPSPKLSAAVMMVAFADKTALGSEHAIAALAATRANEADEAEDLVADLDSLRGAPDIPAAVRELISKAQGKRAEAALKYNDRLLAERRLSALQRYAVPIAGRPEDLPLVTKSWQIRSEVLREHASLRRTETGVEKLEEKR